MKKARAVILLIISVCVLGLIIYKEPLKQAVEPLFGSKETKYEINGEKIEYTDLIMGIAVVEDASFLDGLEKLEVQEKPEVYFEEKSVPYDTQQNIIYIPQNSETADWQGVLSAGKDAFLCTLKNDYWDQKSDAINESHEFMLWLVTKEGYYEMSLILSGMPIITIETDRFEEAEEIPYEVDPDKKFYGSETKYYGTIQVFNPGVGTDGYEITECYVRYHEKGNSSKMYPKKGYSLSLQDMRGVNLDLPLLGMRSDNSWKLNALMNDKNKIREKTASQIWEQFDLADTTVNEAGPRMEYTELILDGDYVGLYCLVEPVDEEKLQLDANDALYKIVAWEPPTDEAIQYSIDMKWRIALPIRLRYPEDIADYEAAWYPMRDYLNIFYRDYWQYGGGIDKVHLGNSSDMMMFLMVCSASDNNFKNVYMAADVAADGSYVMRHIPWDLDLTFGNVFDWEAENDVDFEDAVDRIYWDAPVSTMMYYEIEGVRDFFNKRWTAYRKDFLSTENILQIMTDNRDYLLNSGVVKREQERWPEYEVDMDISYLLDFQTERMEWLDSFFETLK